MSESLQPPATATLDAAEPWRENLGTRFQDLVPEALDQRPAPRGCVAGVRLGAVGVFTVSGTPQVVRRSTSAVRKIPGDLIKVCVQLAGRATVHQGGHEVVLQPGQLAVYDTGQPYAIRLEGRWTCAVMALPRAAIRSALSGRWRPSGRPGSRSARVPARALGRGRDMLQRRWRRARLVAGLDRGVASLAGRLRGDLTGLRISAGAQHRHRGA